MFGSLVLVSEHHKLRQCLIHYIVATETWEKVVTSTLKPKPRSESVAFSVSELLLNDNSSNSLETKNARIRNRTCNSSENRCRHSAYFINNRVCPSEKDEKTYIFEASLENYVDGSDGQQTLGSEGLRSSRKILHEITKLSQMNITRLNNKCNYSVLTTGCTDSTECLLKQHSSPVEVADGLGTPTRGKMYKLKQISYSFMFIYSNYLDAHKEQCFQNCLKEIEFIFKRICAALSVLQAITSSSTFEFDNIERGSTSSWLTAEIGSDMQMGFSCVYIVFSSLTSCHYLTSLCWILQFS